MLNCIFCQVSLGTFCLREIGKRPDGLPIEVITCEQHRAHALTADEQTWIDYTVAEANA
jgi:hypothetical protein